MRQRRHQPTQKCWDERVHHKTVTCDVLTLLLNRSACRAKDEHQKKSATKTVAMGRRFFSRCCRVEPVCLGKKRQPFMCVKFVELLNVVTGPRIAVLTFGGIRHGAKNAGERLMCPKPRHALSGFRSLSWSNCHDCLVLQQVPER